MEFKKDISKEMALDIALENGMAKLTFSQNGTDGGASVTAWVSVDSLLTKLAEKIPGQVDDAVIAVLKQALKLV